MARTRTKLVMSPEELAQLKQRIRAADDPRDKERLQVVCWATSGQHTLEDLAGLAGRARSTIQVWLDAFTAGGWAQLLTRETPPGAKSGGRARDSGATPGRPAGRALAHSRPGGRLAQGNARH